MAILQAKQNGSSTQGRDRSSEEEVVPKLPTSVNFIVGNEFCERFSYYGMRTVLALYLVVRFDTLVLVLYFSSRLCGFCVVSPRDVFPCLNAELLQSADTSLEAPRETGPTEEPDAEKGGFPLSLVCIVATEFCERFAYKGMSTILALYFMVRASFKLLDFTIVS